jgi:hypothetical protein
MNEIEKLAAEYREMAEECMAEAETLIGDGTLSDRAFLESMARKDRLIDHEDDCGHCYTLVCMAEAARYLLAEGEVLDGIAKSGMVSLKVRLNEIGVRRGGKPFHFRSMARFDQQVTTKFHLDGAPAKSMLILGYEPSKVQSRLFLADFTRAAFDLGITPQQFLSDFNPMYKVSEGLLGRYVTELPQPADGHARILLINNSSLPFTEDRTNPLGVMHMAIIVTPDDAESRIVNSTMLVTEGNEINAEKQVEFVTTDKISQKSH